MIAIVGSSPARLPLSLAAFGADDLDAAPGFLDLEGDVLQFHVVALLEGVHPPKVTLLHGLAAFEGDRGLQCVQLPERIGCQAPQALIAVPAGHAEAAWPVRLSG
ncbi:hypothetical protein D3C76_635810 [compost metagenome]